MKHIQDLLESTEDALDIADKVAEETDKRYTHEEMFAKLRRQLMNNENYQLRYLPLFFDDVNNITSYIRNNLSNPQAAKDLIGNIE